MPDLFSHILDQTEPIEQMLAAYKNNRLPHGIVFAGSPGVGKATTAKAMAKLFLCDEGNDPYLMGLIDAGTHPDYHVITKELVRLTSKTSKATTLSIDVVRTHLVEPAMMKSITGKGKVFVVEEADLMQAPAQNSLLKTLEEPAGRTLIILLTPKPEDLLSTIRSRTQVFRFGSLSEKTVFNQLKLRGYDPRLAESATRLSDGSLGVAIQWIEDGVIEKANELASSIDGILNGRASINLADWLKAASDAYAEKQIEKDELASKDNATRTGLNTYLYLMASQFRQALRHIEDTDSLEQLCQAIDQVNQSGIYLDSNVNISLALQQLAATIERIFRPVSAGLSNLAEKL